MRMIQKELLLLKEGRVITRSWKVPTKQQLLFSIASLMSFIIFMKMKYDTSLSLFLRGNKTRTLSLNLGHGNCKWTEPNNNNNNRYHRGGGVIDGTLFATYPAADMGMSVWQHHTEGLTDIQMRDEFSSESELIKVGLIKTNYPHYEATWNYGSGNLNRVILLIRNPRWALPSYFIKMKLHELEDFNNNVTATTHNNSETNPTQEKIKDEQQLWLKWRDYRFEEELNLWALFIDYYMYNGAMYWYTVDFERNGQEPFYYRDESEKPWPQDQHCISDIKGGCVPRTIVSYERLLERGPDELRKIAQVLRNKQGKTMLQDDDEIHCIYHKTLLHSPSLKRKKDQDTIITTKMPFTITQLKTMSLKLQKMINKFSIGNWNNHHLAKDLVTNLETYFIEINIEIVAITEESNNNNDDNTNSNNNPEYLLELEEWYKSIGKGNRYNKEKVQKLDIWNTISYFYDNDGEVVKAKS